MMPVYPVSDESNPKTARRIWMRCLTSSILPLLPLVGLKAQSNYATPYTVTTIAGNKDTLSPVFEHFKDGPALSADFQAPAGIARGADGSIYIADRFNRLIRKLSGGLVSTLAGTGRTAPGSQDGTGPAARFWDPSGVAVDSGGNVYVADPGNPGIRKITAGGVVTTFGWAAGSPDGIAVDRFDHIYVVRSDNVVMKITPEEVVTTVAGFSSYQGSADGLRTEARFAQPSGIAIDDLGYLYIADSGNHTIRKITPDGFVTTLAGTANIIGSADGTGSAAQFYDPKGIAVDRAGNLFVSDYQNNTMRKITADGVVTTIAGDVRVSPFNQFYEGVGQAARFLNPYGVTVDDVGNVYIGDHGMGTIRKATPPNAAPTFTPQPTSQRATVGSAVTFIVGASGAPTPTFQWQKNGVDIAGATSRGLVLSNVILGDAATYRVVARNSQGTATSNAVTLTVVPASADFNGDGRPDIIWQNPLTGQRGVWLMNGSIVSDYVTLDPVGAPWQIAAAADFNGDGKTDILWQNPVTGQRGVWLMNGTVITNYVALDPVGPPWQIAAAADFNRDGKPDILWQNPQTGQRGVWLMNGTTIINYVALEPVGPPWNIAGAADFNGDGSPDIVWENPQTGQRGIWTMNGTVSTGYVALDPVGPPWQIAGAADFNGDGKPDILWQNPDTGQRGIWTLNGTTVTNYIALDPVSPPWQMRE